MPLLAESAALAVSVGKPCVLVEGEGAEEAQDEAEGDSVAELSGEAEALAVRVVEGLAEREAYTEAVAEPELQALALTVELGSGEGEDVGTGLGGLEGVSCADAEAVAGAVRDGAEVEDGAGESAALGEPEPETVFCEAVADTELVGLAEPQGEGVRGMEAVPPREGEGLAVAEGRAVGDTAALVLTLEEGVREGGAEAVCRDCEGDRV